LKRIIDYDWSISYDLRLTTSIVDRDLCNEPGSTIGIVSFKP